MFNIQTSTDADRKTIVTLEQKGTMDGSSKGSGKQKVEKSGARLAFEKLMSDNGK